MTSGECFGNKWFYMKYIGKYLSVEILLTCECTHKRHPIVLRQKINIGPKSAGGTQRNKNKHSNITYNW